ncbi:Sec-independent protein translocase TatC [Winogradskyella epiphytica]|uniref:Sec-independent protein translocase protein TatC n=1 Tax=Winogradskyella epiphytica TaxID=262005 RepID=A0A2V4WYL8_9FLAO|nr:twin-arginine translocase subunit TatC [Winogradskyella epiphytica]PYE82112.1 Sec-independent protein translocase TatC [Winogradskyella epiphytica]GGW60451.1 Sec-independent protein translocase protein TatC [Winogradskyella epiphytica]
MAKKQVDEMSFLDHLEELRWHLIRATLGIVIAGILAFIFKKFIFDVIIFGPTHMSFPTYEALCNMSRFLGMSDTTFCAEKFPFIIQNRTVAGQFSAHIWTSIYAGFIIAFPYVLYQLWSFISPGLKTNERKNSRGFLIIASLLFFLGVLFGYYIITPLSINFLANYQISDQISNEFDISSVIAIVRSSALASGFVFELPIIIYFLTKVGLVTPQVLRKYRKFALVIVLILSAVITPPDIASQVIVAIPILLLYQISIYISAIVVRNQKRKEAKAKKKSKS